MAAYVKFVKKEHVKILREYLDNEGVALIFPEAQKYAKEMGLENNELTDYDFGGESDIFVDTVWNEEHYFFECYLDKSEIV